MENLKSEKNQLARLEQLRGEKKYKEFFSAAEETVMAFPDSFPVKFLYAEVLIETKQVKEAENVLQDLLFAYPDNINLLLELGKVTFNLKKYDQAVEYFNKILFLDPFNDQAKTLLVKIEKSKEGTPEGGEEEKEGKPLDFITYTKEKEKARIDELVMPEAPAEESPQERSDIDTTPFTAATKPEDEFDTVEKPDFDTKKVVLDVPSSVGSPDQPGNEEPDIEFDIPSLDEPDQPPPIPEEAEQKPGADTKEMAAVKYDIPPVGETGGEQAEDEAAADTIVEMEAPQMPGVEQGPPIPPPGLEDDIPAPREEEAEFEYKIPAQRPFTSEADGFEIPPALEDSQDDIKVEYEIPSQEPLTPAGEADEFDIPSPQPQPSETAAGEEIEMPLEMEYSGTQRETDAPGKIEKDGENQQDEREFMTESAAELYLSQGLLDDALTIYEKLYQARKEERYFVKIRQISKKRITRKKIQALTRLLNLIEKKGENRV